MKEWRIKNWVIYCLKYQPQIQQKWVPITLKMAFPGWLLWLNNDNHVRKCLCLVILVNKQWLTVKEPKNGYFKGGSAMGMWPYIIQGKKKNDDDSESYKQTESIISFIKCFISLFFLYKKTPRSTVYIDWMLNDIQFK